MPTVPNTLGFLPLATLVTFGPPQEEPKSQESTPTLDYLGRKFVAALPAAAAWIGVRYGVNRLRFMGVPFAGTTQQLFRRRFINKLMVVCQDPNWRQRKIGLDFQQAFNLPEVALTVGRELLLWGVVMPRVCLPLFHAVANLALPIIYTKEEAHDFVEDLDDNYSRFGTLTFLVFGLYNTVYLYNLTQPLNPTRLAFVARRAQAEAIAEVRARVDAGQMTCQPGLLDRLETVANTSIMPSREGDVFIGFEAKEFAAPMPAVDPQAVEAVGGGIAGILLLRQLAVRGMSSPNPAMRYSGLAAAAALFLFSGESLQMEDVFPGSGGDGYDDGGSI